MLRSTLVSRVLIGLLIIALLFGVVEFTARLALPQVVIPSRPADLFWTPDYQAEYQAAGKVWDMVELYFTPRDFAGRWINARGGFRVTTGQPGTYARTIWLFGNSTLYGAEIPDALTIASRLQARLPADTRVVNVGMGSAATPHELARLKTLPVQAGDTVIFYDGQMDAERIFYAADRAFRTDYPVCAGLLNSFAIVRALCNGDDLSRYYNNPAWMGPQVASLVTDYRDTLRQAQAYTEGHGARFYHALQPHLYTVPLTAWERYADNGQRGMAALYVAAWGELERTEAGLNLTHVLDDARRAGTAYYYDAHHTNAAGAAIVADALLALLVQEF